MSNNYRDVLEKARREFAEKDPAEMAGRAAAGRLFYPPPLSLRHLLVPYLGRFYRVSWPEGLVSRWGEEEEASFPTSLIILHYLTFSSGIDPHGKWLSFKELWGGHSYYAAFEQRAQKRLARFFHWKNMELFGRIMKKMGGKPHRDYPNGYLLFALPKVPLLCLFHPGDEEVPSRAGILFDSSANEHLETEDLAVVGEALAARAEETAEKVEDSY